MTIKEKLKSLVSRYQDAKDSGQLQGASEATMRTWIDELLSLFGWNVQNTHQVLTEHTLGKSEKAKLQEIGSTNTRPDYTLVNGTVKRRKESCSKHRRRQRCSFSNKILWLVNKRPIFYCNKF